jgi:adenosylhomocysteinase
MEDLAARGVDRIEWARAHMAVLSAARVELVRKRTLKGLRIGMALHTEAKTAVLALTLKEAGARVRLASCNPLSTDDSVSQALNKKYDLETYARKHESTKEYYENLNKVLDLKPQLVVDDGGDLIFLLHTDRKELLDEVVGANEETTTGINRLKAMAAEGKLKFPVIDVNDAKMKHFFDNRYGTGQSTFDGIMTATNLLIAGRKFVVAGYGWCGRGIAMRARGMGARVVVTEVDHVKAIEAHLDGFEVAPMAMAVKDANFVVSATGCKDVVSRKHIPSLKDGVVLANAGHFDNEISKRDLQRLSKSKRQVRDSVEEYTLKDGRRAYLLAEGRLVNLAAGQGHPVEIMDMSFSIQALCVAHLAEHHDQLKPGVHPVPPEIDEKVARVRLATWGLEVDQLTAEQKHYMSSWSEGT